MSETVKIEFEFTDGSMHQHIAVLGSNEAWQLVNAAENAGLEIVSAWRDDEPWFGLCTDMRDGTP